MTRLLATGDIHLGAGADLADDRLADQAAVLDVIVDLAVDNQVDAILNGGDTFDGPTICPEQEAVYAEFVARCRTASIPIIQATGNGRHDLAKRDRNALSIFKHVPGVHIHDRPDLDLIGDTAICVLPWTPVDRLVAARDGGDRAHVHADAVEMLLSIAAGLRTDATAVGASRAVLLLHWSISGAALPNGMAVDTYAVEPILPIDALEQLGFDAIIASHIHRPQPLGSLAPHDELMPIFYTGSPMPLNFGEGGYDHGVWLLDLDHGVHQPQSPNRSVQPPYPKVQFCPIDSRPLVTGTVDLDSDGDLAGASCLDETDEIVASLSLPLTDAVVRFKVRATDEQWRRIDWPRVRAFLADAGVHRLKEIIHDPVRDSRSRIDTIAGGLTTLEIVDLWCDAEHLDPKTTDGLRQLTVDLQEAAA